MAVIGRRRRPRWLWFLVMITVIVLLVDLVVSTRSDEPSRRVAALGYLDQVRAQIEQSNRQGADVTDVRSKAAELGRAGVTKRLDRVARDAARTLAAARNADAPGDLSDARSLLLTTLWLRARGTRFMKDALESALGKTAPQAAITKMADVGADLTAADRTYEGFLNALNEQPRGSGGKRCCRRRSGSRSHRPGSRPSSARSSPRCDRLPSWRRFTTRRWCSSRPSPPRSARRATGWCCRSPRRSASTPWWPTSAMNRSRTSRSRSRWCPAVTGPRPATS